MLRRSYMIFLVVLISAIAALNFYAYRYHWYFEYFWFDRVMHTLGGIWVASAALSYRYFRTDAPKTVSPSYAFLFVLAAISIIGIGWELFEFSLDKWITFKIHDAANTASDLVFDGVGSTLGAILFLLLYNRSK